MSYQLPAWIQILVAISTIISSTAVFVYIAQLITTKNQFTQQTKTSQDQFELSVKQFTIVNQAYLKAEPAMTVAAQLPEPITSIPPNTLIDGLIPMVAVTNIGNSPLKYKLLKFDIIIAGVTTDVKAPVQIDIILYPAEKLFIGGNPIVYSPTPRQYVTLSSSQIFLDITIEFSDGVGKVGKKIDRRYKIDMTEMGNRFNLERQSDVF